LDEYRFNTGADIALLIPRGDANGNERRVRWGRRWLDDDIEKILVVKPVNDNEATQKKRG
jgi:hypothetical protein